MTAAAGRRRLAVLGHPVVHSLSPVLHHAAFAEHGLGWDYQAIDCTAQELPGLLGTLDGSWLALSLTMPLKAAVLPLLDSVSTSAEALSAVNTVLLDGGRRHGLNTDVDGIRAALDELGVGPVRAPVLLGAGGTAAAALAECARRGAAEVVVAVRSPQRAAGLTAVGERLGVTVRTHPFEGAHEVLTSADVVVATTPVGATDALAAEVAGSGWPSALPLCEVLYHPWPTRLAAVVATTGAPVVGGLSVLVGQAAVAFTAYSGLPAPVAAMRAAGERAAASR